MNKLITSIGNAFVGVYNKVKHNAGLAAAALVAVAMVTPAKADPHPLEAAATTAIGLGQTITDNILEVAIGIAVSFLIYKLVRRGMARS